MLNFKKLDPTLISVKEAKILVLKSCPKPVGAIVSLNDSLGCILDKATFGLIDTPPFDQSGMDGYAFSFDDWDKRGGLKVVGKVQAGFFNANVLNPMEAVRIFTGAQLPSGADTVVIQENTEVMGDKIFIKDPLLEKGNNVRPQGHQGKTGEMVLDKGFLVSPAAISYLAGTGLANVSVYKKPTVGIIITGNELIKPGDPIETGKVFESNSFGLTAALQQIGIEPFSIKKVNDNEEDIRNAVLNQAGIDLLIVTGGVSVGEYDLVVPALEKCGVETIFHRVKQKPGKPLYFGKLNQKLVFGLPGNPAAVLTCFYEYVVPAIEKITKRSYFKSLHLALENDFKKKPGLTFFLKGKTKNNTVTILENQESYLMNSCSHADCLVELDADRHIFQAGEMVMVKMIL